VEADSDAEKSESSGRSAWESSDDEDEMLGSVLGTGQVAHTHRVPSVTRVIDRVAATPCQGVAGVQPESFFQGRSVVGEVQPVRLLAT
jgi:hypothetical protein